MRSQRDMRSAGRPGTPFNSSAERDTGALRAATTVDRG